MILESRHHKQRFILRIIYEISEMYISNYTYNSISRKCQLYMLIKYIILYARKMEYESEQRDLDRTGFPPHPVSSI